MRFRFPHRFVVLMTLCQLGAGACVGMADETAALDEWGQRYEREILPIVREKCVECHQGDDPDGGFDIGVYSTGSEVVGKLDVWDEVAKRVRLKEMPPEGSPQLNDDQKSAFHRWVDSRPKQDRCTELASDETTSWYRGYVMSRRLTRTEYANAIRDLVGVNIDASLEIPSDGAGGEGFDTNGASLFTSAIHVEKYLAVATDVIDQALSDPNNSHVLDRTNISDVDEQAAAKGSIARFAHRTWRRPVSDDEVDRLLTLYQVGRDRGLAFEAALGDPLKAILVSPHFMFVIEAEAPSGGVQRLTPHQLATRLSLLLWSSIPDAELLAAADAGRLDTDDQVIAQMHRMLDDPKSIALGESFGLQWLGLTNFLASVRPDQEKYPQYDDSLAHDMREEAVRMVADVFRENRSLLDLLRCDHVVVNRRLAAHYGLELPSDETHWQRIESPGGRRGGVMTLGAVLVSASYPRRTSPVLRGRWVLEEVLGGQVPPPPPGVPALEEAVAEKAMTLRERLELHRQKPDCAACHQRMDPLGFGLENFDALGRWRDADEGLAIDSSGTLPSGETFQGPAELKQLIVRRSGEFEQHFVRKLLGFTLGRELNKFDDCVVTASLQRLADDEHRARGVLETIVTSLPFQNRYFKAAEQ